MSLLPLSIPSRLILSFPDPSMLKSFGLVSPLLPLSVSRGSYGLSASICLCSREKEEVVSDILGSTS